MSFPFNSATDHLQWWVDLSPYDPGSAGIVVKRVSDMDATTSDDDTPPATVYDGDLEVAYSFKSHLWQNGRIAGRSDAGRGTLRLVNVADRADGSGRFDSWTSLRWGRRGAIIAVGKAGGRRVDAYTVRSCLVAGAPTHPDPNSLELPLASALDLLNRPLNLPQFAGTGGAEGGADMANKTKPLVMGRRRRIPGLPIDTANNVFFIGLGPLQAILGLKDGDNPLTFTADFASYAALIAAAAPAAGHYNTCLAAGLVRIAASPTLGLNADVQGYAGGGGYVSNAPRIAERVWTSFLPVTVGQYDATAIAAAAALQPAVAGLYVGVNGGNGLDLLDKFLGGAGFWFAEDRGAVLTLGRLDLSTITGPTDPNCAFVITEEDLELDGLTLAAQTEPPSQIQIGYQEWDQIPATGAIATAQQWRIAVPAAPPANVAIEFPQATPLFIGSPFDDPADAAAEAQRIATLEGTPRRIFDAKGFSDPILGAHLGQAGWIVNRREGLAAGQAVVLVGLDEDQDNATSQLWGA